MEDLAHLDGGVNANKVGFFRYTDQQAIETILSLVEKYGSTSRHASKQGAGMVQGVRGNDKVQTMETNLRVCALRSSLYLRRH